MDTNALVYALNELRVGVVEGESQLHDAIGAVLVDHGYVFTHEARIGVRSRVDFLVGDIAIEAKVALPSRKHWLKQLTRYLSCPQVAALVLVTLRGVNLPKTIAGKPVYTCALLRQWGVALK